MEDKSKRRPNEISLSRVKTIMKSSPDVENVSQESVYLVTKATEMFIKLMVEEAHAKGNSDTLEYKHVSELVQTTDELAFLREIVPNKCTLREIQEYQKEKGLKIKRPGSSSSSDLSFSSDDESDIISFPNEPGSSYNIGHEGILDSSLTRSTAASTKIGESSETSSSNLSQEKSVKGKKSKLQSGASKQEMPFNSSSVEEVDVKIVNASRERSLCEDMVQSPLSVLSISTGSRTPSPSPSYSSLSPDSNSVVNADAASSHSSDCEIIE
ncbi:hypothetical protein C0J52_14832 [Blattella germanica]|nr:hypothetical protein C0J52_14832 [Blattella germanica]